ncbi:MAG: D-alanine--D-alanine ligase [Candidatus Hydrogenedentes bacterium]|nr:D-alanine--D-alanine ligase [Candidatus Hydrogenedentota bacterium]
MTKTHVAVLMGGASSEHDVSIKSGTMVAGNLDRNRFEITPVTITRDGKWKFPGEPLKAIHDALPHLRAINTDCVFLALHGPFGEDGRIQGMFDLLGIPYTGSGCAGSALAMDKVRSKAVVRDAGIRVANQLVVLRREWDADAGAVVRKVDAELGFPCVIKSPCQGSSLGMAIPQNADEFRESMPEVLGYDDRVLAEEYITGTEVTCGVVDLVGEDGLRALPVIEIRPVTAAFFDYHAKYTPGATEEICPAPLDAETTRRIQEVAVHAHELVGCRGFSRSDMILDEGDPVWIEVNTIPGMTETSLLPQAAAAGIPFPRMLELFIDTALASSRKA